MNFKFLKRDRDQTPSAGPAPGAELSRLRHAGDEILTAGDEAIDKALSKDSATFLRATRQQGGQ
jgi:hypothetical protein